MSVIGMAALSSTVLIEYRVDEEAPGLDAKLR
jgi:hypothetical protein